MEAPDLADADFDALLEEAESEFNRWLKRDLFPERDKQLDDLMAQKLTSGGRAYKRNLIYRDLLERQVRKRIDCYAVVARRAGIAGMLSDVRLEEVRERIVTSVGHAIQGLKDSNERDFRAAGDLSEAAWPSQNRYDGLKSELSDVVNDEIRVLKAEGKVASHRTERRDGVQGIEEGAMPYKIPPFPVFNLGNGVARFPGGLPSQDASVLERIHKQLRADVSTRPKEFDYLVCVAVQQCYDALKKIYGRTGAFNDYVLDEALPENAFKIALECGWLPKGARAANPEWRAWIRTLVAGRFSRAGFGDTSESDPCVYVAFPADANCGRAAVGAGDSPTPAGGGDAVSARASVEPSGSSSERQSALVAGHVSEGAEAKKLQKRLIALVRRGRTFAHQGAPLSWQEVRYLWTKGRMYLAEVYGDDTAPIAEFSGYMERAFDPLYVHTGREGKVEKDGSDVVIIDPDDIPGIGIPESAKEEIRSFNRARIAEDRVSCLNRISFRGALLTMVKAARRIRSDIARHDHQPAFTPVQKAGNLAQGIAEERMADIPLPGLDPRDPRSILSQTARKRISDAHADADIIRARALASIEARYRSEPDSDKTLFEYQTTGQTGVEWAKAKVQAAGAVLSIVRDEFRAAGKSGRELRRIMEGELEDAVYSLELTTIQRDLLWQELGLDRYAEQKPMSAIKEIAKGPMAQLPELPSRFQNAFEAAKAKAELVYATRADKFLHHPQLADSPLHGLLLIQKVFFEFCKQARDACREGQLSLAQASKAVDAAWPIICDYYFERERGQGSEEERSKFRVALWRTVTDDQQWKQHLSDLVALAEVAATVSPGTPAAAAQGRPARSDIEKFANDAFAVARDRIHNEHADQQRRALAQAELTGNSGAYLPALIKCGAQHVRETILALADAYLEAFTIHGVPSDTQVDLRAVARQITAGAISGIRGQLRLRSGRLRIAEEGRGVPWHLEIERAMDSAVKEGLLRLKRQRIKAGEGRREMPSPGDLHEKQLEGDETKQGEARSDWLNQKLIDELLAVDTEAASNFSAPNHEVNQKGTEGSEPPEEAKRTVTLVGLPFQKPLGKVPSRMIATDPGIQKLVADHPEALPYVNLIANVEKAQAEAEVAFRKRETTEGWPSWAGVHPWDDKPDLDTTDCPWWVAGAEYLFRLAAEWRKHYPAKPERTREMLPVQVRLLSKEVYRNKVFFHDAVNSKKPKADDLFGDRNAERFANFAFLFAMKKFAEEDLREWEQRAAQTTGAITDLEAGNSSAQPVASASDPSRAAAREDSTGGEGGRHERSATDTPAGHSPKSPVLTSPKTTPRRTPDLQSSRERLDLVTALARELATIKQELVAYCTAERLKQKHPEFILWKHIDEAELRELADGTAFTPKAYAETLTLRKFGITSRETLKKDRRKLRKAQRHQPSPPSS